MLIRKRYTSLWCHGNDFTNLDVTKNIALDNLYCAGVNLPTLDISNNTTLQYLYCQNNQITSLDFSNNTALEDLDCSNNQLTSLDFLNNAALEDLDCSRNQITNLDVSDCTSLRWLLCEGNDLRTLDVSKNTELVWLVCSGNPLASLDISNNKSLGTYEWACCYNYHSDLDISDTPSLYEVCVWNTFTAYTVTDSTLLDPYFTDTVVVNITGSSNVYFTTECSGSTELLEYGNKEFSIYPNPSNTLITIETGISNLYNIEIISLNGQLMYNKEMEGSSHQIDLSSLQKGVYFITIRLKDFVTTRKIIKL